MLHRISDIQGMGGNPENQCGWRTYTLYSLALYRVDQNDGMNQFDL